MAAQSTAIEGSEAPEWTNLTNLASATFGGTVNFATDGEQDRQRERTVGRGRGEKKPEKDRRSCVVPSLEHSPPLSCKCKDMEKGNHFVRTYHPHKMYRNVLHTVQDVQSSSQ